MVETYPHMATFSCNHLEEETYPVMETFSVDGQVSTSSCNFICLFFRLLKKERKSTFFSQCEKIAIFLNWIVLISHLKTFFYPLSLNYLEVREDNFISFIRSKSPFFLYCRQYYEFQTWSWLVQIEKKSPVYSFGNKKKKENRIFYLVSVM